MTAAEKRMLVKEAKMQTEALARLAVWRRAALSLAAIGVLLAVWCFTAQIHILGGIASVLMAGLSGAAGFLISTGRRHGKRNVENILWTIEHS